MDISENEWRVLERADLIWFNAAGGKFAAANRSVAICAKALIEWFSAKVEPLSGKVLDDWSWAKRPVTGRTTGFSNHASATAWDLNATRHPRGKSNTFTPAQVREIRKMLKSITDDRGVPVFRWGGDYINSPKDEMHFEINITPVHVDRAAAKLQPIEEAPEMQWTEKIKLGETDARVRGMKKGDLVEIGEMIRFPSGVLRAEEEIAEAKAAIDGLKEQFGSLQSAMSVMQTAMATLNTNIAALTSAVNKAVPIPDAAPPPHG